ncbi:MBL fold metallo-hydrolase RNA specificity domain-containing protein [Thalassotalea piscium]|uniref:Metallo-beta-lactamase family protein n=1 Tax=Thalassotalea piscium TaxID=1230533 RepID=A0A7X0NFZ0_9GAMM|nr:MBL fold metallo-hydrolase [Thalassotalea piscium]MBB6542754.1 metallo-beta-lactamase family protein [Thalassotalea piscium]
MNILHHGAVSGVTGSCHQLVINQQNSLLVDCGLFQGAEITNGDTENALAIEFDISSVQALIVTHCHIDHVGRIPYLLAAGFKGPIYATEATASLLPLVIADALKVGVTRNQKIIDACLKLLKQQLVSVPYKHWIEIPFIPAASSNIAAVKVKFQPAGHILGSAYVEIDCAFKQVVDKKSERIVFSGDLGAPYAPLLAAPKAPYRADVLVIESTYGDKLHDSRKQRSAKLQQVIEHAVKDNGVVLIPAFSIGRTQELLYEFEHIIHQAHKLPNKGVWQSIEVIVDSPMAANFTKQYRQFKTLWDKEALNKVKHQRHPLNFEQLVTIDTHDEHIRTVNYLASRNKPAIVIAASGMCSGGRIVNYLEKFLNDETADVIFVGYQAQGTLGRDIQYYGDSSRGKGGYVYINGQRIDIKAQIHTISGYSAHADQKDLVNFVKRMKIKPKKIKIVHGDEQAKAALKYQYKRLFPSINVTIAV